MIKLPLFLLCLIGIAAGSVRKLAGINGYISDHPDGRCDKIGQFLLHPFNRCSYLVCDYGHEPWKDAYGKTKYYARIMKCAPGTAVPKSAYNEGTQKLNPHKVCTEHYSGHCPARVEKLSGNFFGGARYTPRYDSDEGYGGRNRHSSPSISFNSFEKPRNRYDSHEEPRKHSSFNSHFQPSHGSGYGLRRHGQHPTFRFGRPPMGYHRNTRGHDGYRRHYYKRQHDGGSFIYPKSLKTNDEHEDGYQTRKRYENEPTEFEKATYRKPEKTYERPTYAAPKQVSYRPRNREQSYGPSKPQNYQRPVYHEDSYQEQPYKEPPTKVPYRAPHTYAPSFATRRPYRPDNSYSQKKPSYRPSSSNSYTPRKSSYERPSSSYESANTYDRPSDISYPKSPSHIKYPGPPKELDYPKAPAYSANGYHPLVKNQSPPNRFGLKNRHPRQRIYPRQADVSQYKFRAENNQDYRPPTNQYKPRNQPNRYAPNSDSQYHSKNHQGPPPPPPQKPSNQYQTNPNQFPPKNFPSNYPPHKPQNQYPQPNKHFQPKPNFQTNRPRYNPGPQNHPQPQRPNQYAPKSNQFPPSPPQQNQYQPQPQQNQYQPPQNQRAHYQQPPPPPQQSQPQPHAPNQYKPSHPNQYQQHPAPQQNQYPPQQQGPQGPSNNYPRGGPHNNFPSPQQNQIHQNQGRYEVVKS